MDLNLLITFNALMEERSVTGAARRMFVSQPAMSRAFDRLQEMFEDDLLVRRAKEYEPTHRASVIHAELQQLLPRVEALFSEPKFDPAKEKDLFRIESTDWGATVLIPRLIRVLAERAPGIQIDIVPRTVGFESLESNEIDLTLSPNLERTSASEADLQHLRSQALFREKLVCVVRAGHPLAKRRLTLRQYLKAQHIALSPMAGTHRSGRPAHMSARQPSVAKALERIGKTVNVRVRIPYFAPLGPIVETTDLIATVPLQVARLFLTSKLRIVPAPIEFHGFSYDQIWHSRHDSTPLHKWMRDVIRTVAAHLA